MNSNSSRRTRFRNVALGVAVVGAAATLVAAIMLAERDLQAAVAEDVAAAPVAVNGSAAPDRPVRSDAGSANRTTDAASGRAAAVDAELPVDAEPPDDATSANAALAATTHSEQEPR